RNGRVAFENRSGNGGSASRTLARHPGRLSEGITNIVCRRNNKLQTFQYSFQFPEAILDPVIKIRRALPIPTAGAIRGGDMNAGHALIVDDSKTAQHRLKLMLEKFDLGIEMVASAEEALAHLSYNQPAVIFLDHHMAGMSGMDALKTIKANPATALLPVIMYTSEKDELFIGQARALGALDILSKSTMQPSNLERVLESLNIRPRGSAAADSEEK